MSWVPSELIEVREPLFEEDLRLIAKALLLGLKVLDNLGAKVRRVYVHDGVVTIFPDKGPELSYVIKDCCGQRHGEEPTVFLGDILPEMKGKCSGKDSGPSVVSPGARFLEAIRESLFQPNEEEGLRVSDVYLSEADFQQGSHHFEPCFDSDKLRVGVRAFLWGSNIHVRKCIPSGMAYVFVDKESIPGDLSEANLVSWWRSKEGDCK